MVMRLSTFDEDLVIEYTCCTACISRNHRLGPRVYTLCTHSSFSSFETRENIDLEEGGPVPCGLVKTPENSTDPLDDHVDKEKNSRVAKFMELIELNPAEMKLLVLDRIIPQSARNTFNNFQDVYLPSYNL